MQLAKTIEHALLVVPLILAIGWLSVVANATIAMRIGAVTLSPARSDALITGLLIFIVGYLIFLGIIYSEELKKFIHRATI